MFTWLKNLKVTYKLAIIILIGILSSLAVGLIGDHYLAESKKSSDDMYENCLMPIKLLNESRALTNSIQTDIFHLMISDDPAMNQELKEDIDKKAALFNENMEAYQKIEPDPFEVNIMAELKNNIKNFREARAIAINLALNNENEKAYQFFQKNALPYMKATNKNLQDLSDYNAKVAHEISQSNKEKFIKAQWTVIGIILLFIILNVLMGWLISGMITSTLLAGINHLGVIAKGDFSMDVPDNFLKLKDELGDFAKAVDMMQKNYRSLIKEMTNTSQQLASASEKLSTITQENSATMEEIVASTQEISSGLESVSATAEEINASTETIDANINQISQTTQHGTQVAETVDRQAVQLLKNAQNSSQSANAIYEEMNKRISEAISEAKIVSEISTMAASIAAIAEQTNLLALNAPLCHNSCQVG